MKSSPPLCKGGAVPRLLLVLCLFSASLICVSSQCLTAPSSCPPNSTFPVPTPWFNLSFAVNPTTLPQVGPVTSYNWLQTDNNADNCATYHSGLVNFNGSAYGNSDTGAFPVGPWANLSTSSGPTSVGYAITGIIGGAGSGSLANQTMGWSFETTVKVSSLGTSVSFAKPWDLGQNQTIPGTCQADVIFAIPLGGPTFGFTTCSVTGTQNKLPNVVPSVITNQWYHVILIAQYGATTATYLSYVNGALSASLANQQLLPNVSRPFSNLGRSNFPGDDYFNGTIDTFNIYDVALTQSQATALYYSAMGACPLTVVPPTQPISSVSSSSAAPASSSAVPASSSAPPASSSALPVSSSAVPVSSSAAPMSTSVPSSLNVGSSSPSSSAPSSFNVSSSSPPSAVSGPSSSNISSAAPRGSSSSAVLSSSAAAPSSISVPSSTSVPSALSVPSSASAFSSSTVSTTSTVLSSIVTPSSSTTSALSASAPPSQSSSPVVASSSHPPSSSVPSSSILGTSSPLPPSSSPSSSVVSSSPVPAVLSSSPTSAVVSSAVTRAASTSVPSLTSPVAMTSTLPGVSTAATSSFILPATNMGSSSIFPPSSSSAAPGNVGNSSPSNHPASAYLTAVAAVIALIALLAC